MSDDRDGGKRDSGFLALIAVAATAGAIIAGIATAASAYWSEPPVVEEPVRSTAERRRTGSSSARMATSEEERTSREVRDLEAWMANYRPGRESDEDLALVPEGLRCKICEHKQITHVLECGHTLCQGCAVNILSNSGDCPFDRKMIRRVPQKLYL